MTQQSQTAKPRSERLREMLVPKEPLLIFKSQPIALWLPLVFGLMTLLATFFVLMTLREVQDIRQAQGLARGELTVFIPSTPGLAAVENDPVVRRTMEVLQNTPSLGRIEELPAEEVRGLLTEALGSQMAPAVPLPTVIRVSRAKRDAINVEDLRLALDRAAPGALLDDNAELTRDLNTQMTTSIVGGLVVLMLVFSVAGAVTVLAVGQAVELQKDVLDVLFLSGAPDQVIEQQFTGFALRCSLIGAGCGALAGWVLATVFRPEVFGNPGGLLPLQLILCLTMIAVLTGLSVLTARWNVLRKLKRTF